MNPTRPVPVGAIRRVVADLIRDPMTSPEWRPAYHPAWVQAHPETALSFDASGVPSWWPDRDPRTLAVYAPADRGRWFLETVAGELLLHRETFLTGSLKARRLLVASVLIEMEAMGRPEDIPPPDFL